MPSNGPLAGRLAIVTGSRGLLGTAWTRALEEAGARVVGLDLEACPGVVQADVTDRASLEAALAGIGTPDVLVNNAGIDQPPTGSPRTYRAEDVPVEDFRTTLDVNLTGTYLATQVFGSAMRDAGRGSIVNIGSLYATIAPDPSLYDHLEADPPFLKPAAYGASKAGVLSLTRYFARLWGPSGVRVNTLSPGGIAADQDDRFVAKYCARVPLGRMATAADVGGALVFLASDAARYVTGQELRVDGGLTA